MSSEPLLAETEVLIEEQSESPPAPQAAPPPASTPPAQDDLTQLRRHLQSVRQQVERVEGWVESSLSLPRVTSSAPEPGSTTLATRVDELLVGLDRLERTLNGSRNKAQPPEGTAEVSLPKLASMIMESHQRLSSRLKGIEEKLGTLSSDGRAAREALERALPAPDDATIMLEEAVAEASQKSGTTSPQKPLTPIDPAALFGRDLIDDARTEAGLVELTRRITDDDPKAVGLVGQLMSWRSASRERLPKLLGEVGDAYYACFPRTSDQIAPLEQALVVILARKCVECDVPNSIELVRLGERFDPSRHRLRVGERGVEVTEIHGWIVVGPDGQILNRAQVGVK